MKMKPMGDFVLLKTHEGQETTKAGIILTSNTTNHVQADVIATGPGLFTQTGDRIPITVKTGDGSINLIEHELQEKKINYLK